MRQSRLGSAVESVANVAIGLGINVVANLLVLPLFGFAVTLPDALGIAAVFTGIAVARNYGVRRLFERLR